MPKDDRLRFEQEYRDWIRLMSRDAAHRLLALSPAEQKAVLKAYEDFKDPIAVFRRLSQPERVKSLAGDKISSFIIIETDAVTFFPTVYSSIPGVLDYAVATNRRLFCQGRWFPIISLNSEYIRQSSDRVLRFALEHEIEMNRIYQEISLNLKALSQNKKREVMDSAKEISKDRLKITQEELIEDEKLMDRLSKTQPLLPKPFAEKAMLLYLETNLPELRPFSQRSQSSEEESFGEELYEEFLSWSKFSQATYELFVREIRCNLRDANQGYG